MCQIRTQTLLYYYYLPPTNLRCRIVPDRKMNPKIFFQQLLEFWLRTRLFHCLINIWIIYSAIRAFWIFLQGNTKANSQRTPFQTFLVRNYVSQVDLLSFVVKFCWLCWCFPCLLFQFILRVFAAINVILPAQYSVSVCVCGVSGSDKCGLCEMCGRTPCNTLTKVPNNAGYNSMSKRNGDTEHSLNERKRRTRRSSRKIDRFISHWDIVCNQ